MEGDNAVLGRSPAPALGSNESVLLLGHGMVVTSSTLNGVVSSAAGLVTTARRRQARSFPSPTS